MSTATPTKATNEIVTPEGPKSPLAIVSTQVRGYLSKGTLQLPPDYSPENAMKAAWLMLQNVKDKEQQSALRVCTQDSIVNALMSMVIQGLNVDKKQCYLIVYGKSLVCQRSYFGDIALAERCRPGISVYCDVIYKGEEFAVGKQRSNTGFVTVVTKHIQAFPRTSKDITGAYCGAIDTTTGEDLGIELMDIDQIKQSWKKSKTMGPTSFHNEQPDQAAKRTVIRRWAKPIINSSSDALLLAAVRESDMDAIDGEVAEDALEHANGEMLSLPPAEPAPEEPATPAAEGPVVNNQGHLMEKPAETGKGPEF